MLRKLPSLFLLLLVMYVLPLAFRLELIGHVRIIVLMIFTAAIWLTQPPIDFGSEDTSQDRRTVYWILGLTLPAVIVPVMWWGWMSEGHHPELPGHMGWIGLGMLLIGLVLRVYAIRVLDRFFTAAVVIQDEHRLIQEGPYRWLRHPSYTGAYLCYIGSALWLEVWPGVIGAALLMGYAYNRRVTAEEAALEERFGEAYQTYKQHSWRMIPGIW